MVVQDEELSCRLIERASRLHSSSRSAIYRASLVRRQRARLCRRRRRVHIAEGSAAAARAFPSHTLKVDCWRFDLPPQRATAQILNTGGGTRTRTTLRSTDFLTTTAFAACREAVCGLDYTFTFYYASAQHSGGSRLVSTLFWRSNEATQVQRTAVESRD